MNNEIEKKLQSVGKSARHVALSEQEKNLIFKNLDAFVRANPIEMERIEKTKSPNRLSPRQSPYFSIFSFQYRHAFSFALIVFVVFGGGTSYAAADALPGDILYSIKIGLNEKIVPLFLSDVKKVTYSARLAGERLKEAATLASTGNLDDQKVAIIEEQFEKQESKAETDAEFAAEFEEVLKENESELSILVEKKRESAAALVAKLPPVPPEVSDSKSIETDTISSRSSSPAAFGIASSEPTPAPVEIFAKKLAPVAEQSPKANTATTLSTTSNLPTDISAASSTPAKLLEKGDEALEAKDFSKAFKLYRKAYDAASEAGAKANVDKVDVKLDASPK